ncbi:isocitrate lyase/PEP mutase family protein [Cognatilysobacter bugurensis]|uniref:Isocitrate lyase/phosphoenolpyruvate mutase family protein n=1 Tax=Cognatilysobacter bugurensis TaxID=543356 RepID=A0A918W5I9_9GAMM|nr:isocitrate lyase/phosphoenolpyruvate mutase family protein [Lysobacter bugurensis]GHA68376.1 hypothetical protein GCM10007067_00260 [Lysobacter bugurensis]
MEDRTMEDRTTDTLHARFVALHRQPHPLLLANAWDAASARLWQEAGAPAIATASAAVSWSRGYPDGGALPRHALIDSMRDIVRVTDVPVTVDLEDGYSDDADAVADLVAEVVSLGAVGINLEDGAADPERLAAKIDAVRRRLGPAPVFINARTDVYLRGLATGAAAVRETVSRLSRYAAAGADGGFVPGLTALDEMAGISAAVPVSLNIMALPGLPPPASLARAGVRRISTGPGLFKAAYAAGRESASAFLQGDLAPMFERSLDYSEMNRMLSA